MKNKKGFTLAEIIISMTIIGVIAAITIPALLVSTNEKTLEAQKKALLARMSQAISQIDDLRVYKKTDDTGTIDKSSALNFISASLSKVYRITKSCDKDTLVSTCGFPDEVMTQDGGTFKISNNETLTALLANSTNGNMVTISGLDTQVAGFKTANGESIALYYNPNCRGSNSDGFYKGNAASIMCLNMIYDLNGKDEAPNEVGKDIGFLTVFYPKDPDIAAPVTYAADATTPANLGTTKYGGAIAACKNQNKALIMPSWSEGLSMAINKQLSNLDSGKYLVSGAGALSDAYDVNVGTLASETADWGGAFKLRCVYNR